MNAFDALSKPIREALRERGFTSPTDPQLKAIPEILTGVNVLLISPTASGKTEAAILPVFSMYVSDRGDDRGIKILYITPLRALNRDMLERLQWWAKKLDLKVAVRHGDTETKERAMQAKDPPDMLILTPETLQAILTGRIMKQHLKSVRFVIIDEVHELAEDKRGSQLVLALERLRWASMHDFQCIGLSATIGTPDRVAKFLAGHNRAVSILHVPVGRQVRIQVASPQPKSKDFDLSARLYTHPEVAARLRLMREVIDEHQTVILFTNTRSIAEILTSRMKVWDNSFPISIHHGSLARLSRITAEQGLKAGQLKGLIATSSLELGIDVGSVDFVIQYMSPRQVTRLIQRIGRSGHRIGRLADGMIVSSDSDDTLEALVIARRALSEILEPVTIPDKPLDVLTHQLVGLLIQKSRWYVNELMELLTKAYPYRDLTEADLVSVITYMHTRFPRLAWYSPQDTVILRPRRLKPLYSYYFGKLSMIPDEKQYLIIDQGKDEAIGVLDEAFVAEYAEPGRKFIVRGSPWKMTSIRADKIYVKQIKDPTGSIPSWVGEEIPVPFDIAQEVGSIRRNVENALRERTTEKQVADELSKVYPAAAATIKSALAETFEQFRAGYVIPTDQRIVLEDWEDFVIINSHFGLLVNRTLARLIGHLLSEDVGVSIGVQQDPYRIVVQTSGSAKALKVSNILRQLRGMDIEYLTREASKKSGLFKRRLVHVAKRFGAITRYADFQNVKLRQVIKSLEGTVIMEEAFKETLEKDLDIHNTKRVLSQLENEIELYIAPSQSNPTPIARIGIERISRKTDLIPPEKMKRILIESTKVRILNEARLLACASTLDFAKIFKISEMPENFSCPKCDKDLGISSDMPELVEKIRNKRGRNLSESETKAIENLKATSILLKKHGKIVAYVLAGRRLNTNDVKSVLRRTHRISDRLYESIIEQEKKALRRRFW